MEVFQKVKDKMANTVQNLRFYLKKNFNFLFLVIRNFIYFEN